MVEVQKPMFFWRFLRCSRDPLRGSAWSRCRNSRFFATVVVRTGPRELSRGSRACSRNRRVAGSIPPWSAGVARCNLHFKATCAEQLAQSKLHRATCADQLAPTSLRRAPCLEQLAQSNLRRATYAEQLAQSNLHRAPCLVLSRACFTNASCREKERILQRWADLACDVLLSGQPWSSFFGGGSPKEGHAKQRRNAVLCSRVLGPQSVIWRLKRGSCRKFGASPQCLQVMKVNATPGQLKSIKSPARSRARKLH